MSTKEKRWYKDVGLGFKTPAEAINGTYIGASVQLVPPKQPGDDADGYRQEMSFYQ